ncbi:MAG TPA: hypothetical protein VIL97_11890 [Thermoanaerobaculia bacterium]
MVAFATGFTGFTGFFGARFTAAFTDFFDFFAGAAFRAAGPLVLPLEVLVAEVGFAAPLFPFFHVLARTPNFFPFTAGIPRPPKLNGALYQSRPS